MDLTPCGQATEGHAVPAEAELDTQIDNSHVKRWPNEKPHKSYYYAFVNGLGGAQMTQNLWIFVWKSRVTYKLMAPELTVRSVPYDSLSAP